jgi:hypothetical protein
MERGSRNRSSSARREKKERELVIDRRKWKDIVRQAKANIGLLCQWKKKKKIDTNVYGLGYRPTGLQLYLLFVMGVKLDLTIQRKM